MLSIYVTGFEAVRALVAAGCLLIVICIPVRASRRKLHIPGYVGMAFLAFALALVMGRLAGLVAHYGNAIRNLHFRRVFFLMATAVGSTVAIFFYRYPKV